MDSDSAVAILANPHSEATCLATALESLILTALTQANLDYQGTLAGVTRLLRAPGLPAAVHDRALWLLAAVIHVQQDAVDDDAAEAVGALLEQSALPPATMHLAGEMFVHLLLTPARIRVPALLRALAARPDQDHALYAVVLEALQGVATWAFEQLEIEAIVALAEYEHLAHFRPSVVQRLIERLLLADPASVTVDLLERLRALYGEDPAFRYAQQYLAGRPAARPEVRAAAAAMIRGRFPLRRSVQARLSVGRPRVLLVQNVRDGQGDEIIRVAPLVQALLDANPRLEVTLLTGRTYLYAHPRLTAEPITDPALWRRVLRQSFDMVFDCYESNIENVNWAPALEPEIQAYVLAHRPSLFLAARKGVNHFRYEVMRVDGAGYAEALGLRAPRVPNVYETTCRLLAELGLPLRLGEEQPLAGPVLAALPCPEAEAAWTALTSANGDGRPVAILNPFGGQERLKGYVEATFFALAARILALRQSGYFVILLPSGTPWGRESMATQVVALLPPAARTAVAIAPDPAAHDGEAVYHLGAQVCTVPYATQVMRLFMHFLSYADLVVAVEGWAIHAAYCLGKSYQLLRLPRSADEAWAPYGRSRHQDVAPPIPHVVGQAWPPLLEQPQKAVLLLLLGALGQYEGENAVSLLRPAVRGEDRQQRKAALLALCRSAAADTEIDLLPRLRDMAAPVRAEAARALLARWDALPASRSVSRAVLKAHCRVGAERRNWAAIVGLGDDARPVIEMAAVWDEDSAIRHEAHDLLQSMRMAAATPDNLEPVDAVYLWSAGSDPAFQETQEHGGDRHPGESEDAAPRRVRDPGTLRYALRSLERNAPWIRHVYLVTDDRVPAWLKTDHPRLTVVPHEVIFPDTSHLPTFNANAIEMHLHRIPGLSRWWTLIQDDTFLGRPSSVLDFLPHAQAHHVFVDGLLGPATDGDPIQDRAATYTAGLVDAFHERHIAWFALAHCPQLFNRDLLATLAAEWADEMARTSAHRFPEATDLVPRILHFQTLIYAGMPVDGRTFEIQNLTPGSADYCGVTIGGAGKPLAEALAEVSRLRPRFFFLDTDQRDDTAGEDAETVQAFLARTFPDPSAFERDVPRAARLRKALRRLAGTGAQVHIPRLPIPRFRPPRGLPAPHGPYAHYHTLQDQAIEAARHGPDRRLEGRGIVTLAGGSCYFTCAWVCLTMLRHVLGCTLPIQVWYLGPDEMSPAMIDLLRPFDVTCIDALALAPGRFTGSRAGWRAKPFAIAHCGFQEVIWLDADTVPLVDPATLLDIPAYRRTGALFWPDLWSLGPDSPIWSMCRVPYRDEPSFETGLVVMDVARCWTALALANHMNEQAEFYYQHFYGDKDTFHLAWRMLGQDYGMTPHRSRKIEGRLNAGDQSMWLAQIQHDWSGTAILEHRTGGGKWDAWGDNMQVGDAVRHEICLAALRELRRQWDGRVRPVEPIPSYEQSGRGAHA